MAPSSVGPSGLPKFLRIILKVILLLSVFPVTFVILLSSQSGNLKESDPIPDKFPLLVVTRSAGDSVKETINFVFWPQVTEFLRTHPAHSFLLSQESGSLSPSGPQGPLVKFRVEHPTKELQLIEVTWTGGNQTDPNYVFTGRYEAEDKRVFPRYFSPEGLGQFFQAFFISVLIWIAVPLLSFVGKQLKPRNLEERDTQKRTGEKESFTQKRTEEPALSEIHPWVRFWARSLDILLVMVLVGVNSPSAIQAVKEATNASWLLIMPQMFLLTFLWAFLEAVLLSTWGTTPGKWLLKIKVRDANGQIPRFGASLERSLSVWFRGLGCMLVGPVTLVMLAVSYGYAKKQRITPWDKSGGFALSYQQIGAMRMAIAVLFVVLACKSSYQIWFQDTTTYYNRGKDGAPMALVPAGEFLMGRDNGLELLGEFAKPAHKVYLDAFYMDKYEVTTTLYAKFLQATGRKEPAYWNFTRQVSAGDRPVIGVDWDDADAYCRWAGKRLPTEAEWEKAARGTDGRIYPWGNAEPSSRLANYGKSYEENKNINYYSERLKPVGSYEDGKSPYGVYDMAGNAWEWVADWFDPTYYQRSPGQNPKGPSQGGSKVRRGGSWFSPCPWLVQSAARVGDPPRYRGADVGFRCAMDAPK